MFDVIALKSRMLCNEIQVGASESFFLQVPKVLILRSYSWDTKLKATDEFLKAISYLLDDASYEYYNEYDDLVKSIEDLKCFLSMASGLKNHPEYFGKDVNVEGLIGSYNDCIDTVLVRFGKITNDSSDQETHMAEHVGSRMQG